MRSLQFGVLAGYTFSHLATMYEQNDGREAVSLVITNHSRFTVRDDAPDTRPSWSSLVGEISYIVSRERHVCDNIGTPIGRRVPRRERRRDTVLLVLSDGVAPHQCFKSATPRCRSTAQSRRSRTCLLVRRRSVAARRFPARESHAKRKLSP